MGLLSSGKCVSAMRESATFATPVMNKPFPSVSATVVSFYSKHYDLKKYHIPMAKQGMFRFP